MTRNGDTARRVLSSGVAALMLSLSVAMPFMERVEIVHEPVAESEHNPTTCPPRHDHRLCTQVGANFALPSSTQEHALPAGDVHRTAQGLGDAAPSAASTNANRTRAPPAS